MFCVKCVVKKATAIAACLLLILIEDLVCHSVAPHNPNLHPYRSAWGIGVASEKTS